ncbi:MAG: DNA polymerase III subunit gamma/tau [Ruminococcaceae bacterium]|nr:DNA polymerase III subunit gamma/tau [Oscillospiraceae bacterium]
MYQVLYRKYRPSTFEDVVGQPQVTVTLKNELKSGRINHAYLFTGSRGTGKTTCAKILAKAVNCLNLTDSNPCGECENCTGIDSGEILDVVEMDAASNRRIDDIRDIIDEVSFTPAKAKYRVYIIDEVHMLTQEAFNALLKTLEEPPKHVIFILATTEVHKLPATITSRCQRFDFHRIAPKDIAFRLQIIANAENITLTDEGAQLIAVIADGALRDAISLLDRCIGIAEDEVTADIVRNAAGLAQKNYLFELCTCTINKNPAKALSIIDRLYGESKDIPRLCDELITHFRSLMMIKTVKNPREMLAFADREFEAAQSQCDYLSLADIVYSMDVLSRAFERMGKGTNNRTEFEMAIVKLCSPELDATTEALTTRIVALEKAVKVLSSTGVNVVPSVTPAPIESVTETPVAKEKEIVQEAETIQPPVEKTEQEKTTDAVENELPPTPTEESVPVIEEPTPDEEPTVKKQSVEPQPAQPVVNKKTVDLDAVYQNAQPMLEWPEVINNLKQYSRAISAAFEGSNAYVSGDYLLIDTDQEIAFQLLKKSAQRDNIRKAVSEITGRTYKLGPYKKPEVKSKKDDVLTQFIANLKDSGINVTEE